MLPPPSPRPSPPAPRFDAGLGVWLLERYADVTAALHDPRLVAPGEARLGPDGTGARRPGAGAVRAAAGRAFAPDRLAALEAELVDTALSRVRGLSSGRPVDLVGAFAAPWSAEVALRVAGAAAHDAPALTRRARTIFLAAAHATAPGGAPEPIEATAELARLLAAASPAGAARLADPQAFVALSQTLPCLLAAAWDVLLRHPEARARLRAGPALWPRAVEELLRLASPSRAVFREVAEAVEVGGVPIPRGARVVLLLAAANRDPARFPDPDRLDLDRGVPTGSAGSGAEARSRGHLALGQGVHGCPGASLVRLCVAAATESLVATWSRIEPVGPVKRIGGFAIDGPASLPVVLRGGPR